MGRFAARAAPSDLAADVQLTVVDLRARRLFTTKPSAVILPFDFDGRRLAWVAPDGIHVARVR